MIETLQMLIKAIESGELVVNSITMERPQDRSSMPPWAPTTTTWSIHVVNVPEEYRQPIILTDQKVP